MLRDDHSSGRGDRRGAGDAHDDVLDERENTIAAFTADYEFAAGQQVMGKQNLYDHSIRVPFLFTGTGVPETERRDALTCHPDVYPMLCDLAGLETPETIEGRNLVSSVSSEERRPRESLFSRTRTYSGPSAETG